MALSTLLNHRLARADSAARRCHLQDATAHLAASGRPSSVAAKVPITETIARRTLALPFFNRITLAQQEEVAATLSLTMQECKR